MPAPQTPPSVPRKRSRLERTRRLRRLVVTWTVVAFVAAWGGIFVQMRAGDDPALGSGSTAAAISTTSATPTTDDTAVATDGTTSSSVTDDADTSSDDFATQTTTTQADTPSAATTSQS